MRTLHTMYPLSLLTQLDVPKDSSTERRNEGLGPVGQGVQSFSWHSFILSVKDRIQSSSQPVGGHPIGGHISDILHIRYLRFITLAKLQLRSSEEII